MTRYWFRAHGYGVTGWRIFLGATIGPWFWPAWYLAPEWKRSKWHRIGCDDPACGECAQYYDGLEAASALTGAGVSPEELL